MQLRLVDGRAPEVLTASPVKGRPLIFHLGTPSDAVLFRPLVMEASRHKLRTVVYSRPGYARSTAKHGRSVVDAVADVQSILDELEADEFLTIGWSGGGPHALACAAKLPDCCAAAVSLASVAPYPAAGLDWMAGMGAENIEEFNLALQGEAALLPWLQEQAGVLSHIEAADVAAALGGLVSEVDKAALTGQFAEFIACTFPTSRSERHRRLA